MITLDENEARLIIQALEGMTINMSLQGAAALAAVRIKLSEQLMVPPPPIPVDSVPLSRLRRGTNDEVFLDGKETGVSSDGRHFVPLGSEADAFRDDIPYTPRVAKTSGHDPIEIDGKHV